MENIDKYKFDYFTLENYEKIIKLALDQKFKFISFEDDFKENRKDVLWRHDVEFSPKVALEFAKIENKYGVKSTYFVQLHSPYYNTFEKAISNILLEIKDLGHHIGLHFDPHYYNINTEKELNNFIVLDKHYLENVFNWSIKVFSFHDTNPFILSCEDFKYGGIINVYSSFFKKKYNYCADSTGFWRYEILDEVLKDENIKHLQILTHDAMWTKNVLSPRKRIMKSIQDNAERLRKNYDDGFKSNGAKNIDD